MAKAGRLLGMAALAALVSWALATCATAPSGGRVEQATTGADGVVTPPRDATTPAPETTTEAAPTGTPSSTTKETPAGTRGAEVGGPDLSMVEAEEPVSRPATPAPSGGLTRAAGTTAAAGRPQESGLRAGFADDNKQFNYFVQFLDRYGPSVPHEPLDIQERITFQVTDSAAKPVLNAEVTVWAGSTRLATLPSYADGTVLFFPRLYDAPGPYRVTAVSGDETVVESVARDGPRTVSLRLPAPRRLPDRMPMDVVFVMDTTGSMGEEIERLKQTIELIDLNLASVSTNPRLRFGMVLYKDVGDEYVTQVVQPTEDLSAFEASLATVTADGGGDTPEDLQSALRETVKTIAWNPDGIRLAFVITDAPPHLDYEDPYTYAAAARDAQGVGIKIHTVGTGGLDLDGEYVLRQIAQLTYGKYIFLTYGERGESEGGESGSVSHHTGANFQTDKLESIIIRLAREELAFQSDTPLEQGDEYFEALRVTHEERTETLGRLFDMAIQQLTDYSSVRLPPLTRAAAVPLVAADAGLGAQAEYLSEQLVLSLSRSKAYQVVARSDLQAILDELELQLSGLVDDSTAARVGGVLGAEVLLTGRVFAKQDRYELFLKLLRVSTGEVLSVTKALVDRNLGI